MLIEIGRLDDVDPELPVLEDEAQLLSRDAREAREDLEARPADIPPDWISENPEPFRPRDPG